MMRLRVLPNMIKSLFGRALNLRTTLMVSFLTIVLVIVLFTLYIVQHATFTHSTGLLKTNAETSSRVINDYIREVANVLQSSATNLAADFSVKGLILSADTQAQSLSVGMRNFADRFGAEEFAVIDNKGKVLSTSKGFTAIERLDVEKLAVEGITWAEINGDIFLAKSVAVKNTPRSRDSMAWIVFAKPIEGLIDDDLTRLTTMDVSLLLETENSFTYLASIYDTSIQQELSNVLTNASSELQDAYLSSEHYVYYVSSLGSTQNATILLMLSTIESNAYLSYNSLLGRLIGLLVVAATIALMAAMLISNSITKPILILVALTEKIRQGLHVTKFPKEGAAEVNTLSNAISSMQSAILKREQEIERLAFFDSVTSLPNRNRFIQLLEEQINNYPKNMFSVVLIDIARFKEINDTIGHSSGDKLLFMVGERLRSGCRRDMFIARLGGNEFAVIETEDENVEQLMEELLSLFNAPFTINSLSLNINVNIGGARYNEHGAEPSDLMQAADIALHASKDSHKPYVLYHEELNTFSVLRLRLMSELKDALNQGQLTLYYQPKMDLISGTVHSVECLIRWTHPQHGFISPDEFIPLAEQTGAIRYVTKWALREAAQQYAQWRSIGVDIAMAVNISAVDLTDLSLPHTVSALLSEFTMTPNKLILEVTESAVMGDPEVAINSLNMLSRMGIKLSIDDFGTGFSSMAQLKKMPVDEIKIDKAFVLELATNEEDQVMVKTLVAMAKNLGLSTVAEGVENEDSVVLLRDMGCSTAQGFHLSRPLPAKDITQWLETHSNTR